MIEQEKREQVIIELSDCIEILRDIDSSDCSKGDRENLHGSISSAIQDALDLLKGQKQTLEEVAENYGLTPDGVSFALDQYQKVICEITHSRMSKLSYYADDILRVANEVGCDYCEIKEAQEPRVMTLKEIKQERICWIEDADDGMTVRLFPATMFGIGEYANGAKSYMFLAQKPWAIDANDCEWWYLIEDYGEIWRCWTSRPTNAQREATAWEKRQK